MIVELALDHFLRRLDDGLERHVGFAAAPA
jgi:hypothetical protein